MTIGVVVGISVIALSATGCAATEGKSTAAESSATSSQSVSTTADTTASPSTTAPATPTGAPVGTATMAVRGGAGPATIRYQINGGPEQTETNVSLPWEKQYPVYDEIQSSVTADAGDTELICSIIMDGKLLAFKTEPRPTCSFAYWG